MLGFYRIFASHGLRPAYGKSVDHLPFSRHVGSAEKGRRIKSNLLVFDLPLVGNKWNPETLYLLSNRFFLNGFG